MSFPRYPKYKPSGVEWLGEVPEHWGVKRLKGLCRIVTEKADSRSRAVALEHIESGTGRLVGDSGEFEGEGTAFVRGDLLFGKLRPYLAKAWVADFDGEAVGDFHVMRPTRELSQRYFLYTTLNRDFIQLVDGSTYGSKMPRASWDFVGCMPVCEPLLAEQRAIAEFLDRETAKIDALIAEQEKLIELLAEKRQAVISHAVTKGLNPTAPMKPSGVEWLGDVPAHWTVGPLKRFVTSLDGMRVPLSAEERGSRQGDFPYYGASGIIDHIDEFIFQEDLVLVSEDGANLLNRTTPIAFPARGRYWVNNHAHILRPEDPHIVFWSERIDSIDLSPVITGSAQPKLTADELMRLPVAVPPTTAERGSIERFVLAAADACETLSASARSVVDLLRERRSALISAAVTGQIDVRNAAPETAA